MFLEYSECCSVSLPAESIMSDEEVFLIVDAEQMCPGKRVYQPGLFANQPPSTLLIYLSHIVTENSGLHF